MAIDNFTLIDTVGRKISANAGNDERKTVFPPLGVVDVVKLEWTANGAIHEIELIDSGKKSSWHLLPDLSGIILTNKKENKYSLVSVINDDGKNRFSLENPWPKNKFFSPLDDYGFSYPAEEKGKPGVVVWVWSPSIEGGVSAEYFYAIDVSSGEFLGHQPIK